MPGRTPNGNPGSNIVYWVVVSKSSLQICCCAVTASPGLKQPGDFVLRPPGYKPIRLR